MTDTIRLTVPSTRAYQGVVRLVLAGVGARSGLTVEALDDLELALDALLGDPGLASEDQLLVAIAAKADALAIEVGPFHTERLEAGLADRPGGSVGLARLLEATTRAWEIEGRDGTAWVHLSKGAAEDAA